MSQHNKDANGTGGENVQTSFFTANLYTKINAAFLPSSSSFVMVIVLSLSTLTTEKEGEAGRLEQEDGRDIRVMKSYESRC